MKIIKRCLAAALILLGLMLENAAAGSLTFGSVRALSLPGGSARGIAVGDVNGDGIVDVVAAFNIGAFPNNASRFAVFLGLGGGNFSAATIYDPGVGCWTGGGTASAAIELADVNGDGVLDVIMGHGGTNATCASANIATVHLGNGTGGFSAPGLPFITTNGVWGRFGIGDFNGDGKPDLIAMGESTLLHLGRGDGTFEPGLPIPDSFGLGPVDLAIADFDGDGHLDVAIANFSLLDISIYFGTGAGSFSPPVKFAISPAGPVGIVAGDFNGDGRIDIAVTLAPPAAAAQIFLGEGARTFAGPATLSLPQTFNASLVAADFDRDGRTDLVLGNFRGFLLALLGNGNGSFSSPISVPAAANVLLQGASSRVRTADFNGDGSPDLAVTCLTGACVLLNSTTTCAEDLAAAQAVIENLQKQLASAQTTVGTLQSQVSALQAQLSAAQATIAGQAAVVESLVEQLFGARPDANVATAARDVARAAVDRAIAAVGASDPRVRRAQQELNRGLAALAAGDLKQAVRNFREAFNLAQRASGA